MAKAVRLIALTLLALAGLTACTTTTDDSDATPTATAPTETATAAPTPSPMPTPSLQTYRNEKYGYEVTLPEGWRLATQYMTKFAELTSNPRFTAVPEDYVVLTSLSEAEEQEFIDKASQEIGPALSPWYKFAPGESVQISPIEARLEVFLTASEPLAVRENTDIREETLDSGTLVTRLTRRESDDRGEYVYDAVYVPYTFDGCPPSGRPCQGVIIRIVQTPGYDEEAFETIFRGFRESK